VSSTVVFAPHIKSMPKRAGPMGEKHGGVRAIEMVERKDRV